jgi:hypothetical protein
VASSCVNDDVVGGLDDTPDTIERVEQAGGRELQRPDVPAHSIF